MKIIINFATCKQDVGQNHFEGSVDSYPVLQNET